LVVLALYEGKPSVVGLMMRVFFEALTPTIAEMDCNRARQE